MKNWQEKLKKGLEYHKLKIDDKYYVPLEYVLDDVSQLLVTKKEEIEEEWREKIKDLQIKISDPNSEYINKLPQIQILDELLETLLK